MTNYYRVERAAAAGRGYRNKPGTIREHKKSRLAKGQAAFCRPWMLGKQAAPEGAERASPVQCTTTGPESQARRANFPPGEVKAALCAEGQP